MKRILVFSLLLAMLSVAVFADTSYSGSSVPPGEGKDPTVTVQYVIDSNTGSYSIGFASSKENAKAGTALENSTITLKIDSEDNTIISNVPSEGEDTGLYIFWDITSAAQYKLSLEASGALKNKTDGSGIGFTVNGTAVDSNEDETPVDITTSAVDTPVTKDIIGLTTAGTIATKEGMQMLTIKSTAGQLSGKGIGTYSADLTLKLTAN